MEKKRILVVDDEKDLSELTKAILESTGLYEVRVEYTGRGAVTAAAAFQPALILLDLVLQDMEGTEVAFQIKNHEKTRDIPIVFLTGIVSKEEERSQGGMIGGYPFLAKPVEASGLMNCVERNLRC